ncbi:MAG: linear amide C-N hydrolase [Provencibacterium sp.]|jgi:penicillin V acylase-like amidase (Ntn superfamily)|nr:linear amide C-N hydrolase [Provencibacterium sp.]
MNFGCSSFSWETKDGRHLLGRTYDQFGNLQKNQVIALPAGIPCSASLRKKTEEAPSRYGYTGMAVLGFGEPIVVDGVNTAGLMGALLHYPEYAVYEKTARANKTAVHPGRLLAWLFSRCAGVDEAVRAMEDIALLDDLSQGSPLAAHYILSDRSGETVVLEPDAGGLKIHRQTIGVLANSPDYLWHRTHLRAYVGVHNLPNPPRMIAGHEIREFGRRLGGGFGLPGDYSSPSRFVRLAFMKQFAVQGKDEAEGVGRMFRAFAPVVIPEGLARADAQQEDYEQTLCISVMCAESGVYYFAPSQNRRISAVCPLQRKGQQAQYFELGAAQDIDYRN